MKWFTQKTIDVIQWVFIIGLIIMLIVQCAHFQQVKKDLVTNAEYNKENTYVRIYESKRLDKLKRENKMLYDSIAKLNDVESGMVIKFKERHVTDTITVDKFILKHDTLRLYADGNVYESVDSVYHYSEDNDTVKLDIDIKARQLEWYKADFTINDQFMIINREKDGVNQTLISHSDNASIDATTMWHRTNKEKWYKKFSVSPQVGVGYGMFNKKFDAYVGVGVSYRFK
jgi:hypothetical protein